MDKSKIKLRTFCHYGKVNKALSEILNTKSVFNIVIMGKKCSN